VITNTKTAHQTWRATAEAAEAFERELRRFETATEELRRVLSEDAEPFVG
jgi:hypothetical protein